MNANAGHQFAIAIPPIDSLKRKKLLLLLN
jgi:hypothetical protein